MGSKDVSHGQTGYLSYLLRLWPAEGSETSSCRASLESLHGERQSFASLEALLAFLAQQATILNARSVLGDETDDLTGE